jgi:hypothetical protein
MELVGRAGASLILFSVVSFAERKKKDDLERRFVDLGSVSPYGFM